MDNNPSLSARIVTAVSRWLMKEHLRPEMPLSDFDRLRYEIRPGDILLVAGRSRVSEIIRLTTQSTWTHAMIYVGRLYDIEDPALRAVVKTAYQGEDSEQLVVETLLGKGTIVTPLSHYQHHHVRICRPRGISLKDAQEVIGYTIRKIGVEYDIRQLLDLGRLLYPWKILPRRWRSSLFQHKASATTRQICSSLLAEAFGSVHFPILPLLHRDKQNDLKLVPRNPRLFTPSDFDFSPFFEIIKYPFFSLSEDGMYRSLPWANDLISNDEDGIAGLTDEAQILLASKYNPDIRIPDHLTESTVISPKEKHAWFKRKPAAEEGLDEEKKPDEKQ